MVKIVVPLGVVVWANETQVLTQTSGAPTADTAARMTTNGLTCIDIVEQKT